MRWALPRPPNGGPGRSPVTGPPRAGSLLDVRLVGLGVVDAAHVAVVAVPPRVRLDPGPVLAGPLGLVDVDPLVALVLEQLGALLLRLAILAGGVRRRAGREPNDAKRGAERERAFAEPCHGSSLCSRSPGDPGPSPSSGYHGRPSQPR